MRKLIILLGVLGTGFSAIFVRYATLPMPVLAFYRMFICVCILSVPSLVFHRIEWKTVSGKDILLCALSGSFLGAHFVCYFQSLCYTSVASAVVLVDTEVFYVALGSILFLKEKQSRMGWFSILLTFAGSVIVASGDSGGGHLMGDLLAIAGALCSSVYTIIGRKVRSCISTTLYTWLVYCFAGIVTFVATLVSGQSVCPVDNRNLLVALALAVICTLLGHSIFSWGLKYEKASFISTVKLMEPVFATILAVLLLKEIPSISSGIGGLIIITGIILCIRSNKTY